MARRNIFLSILFMGLMLIGCQSLRTPSGLRSLSSLPTQTMRKFCQLRMTQTSLFLEGFQDGIRLVDDANKRQSFDTRVLNARTVESVCQIRHALTRDQKYRSKLEEKSPWVLHMAMCPDTKELAIENYKSLPQIKHSRPINSKTPRWRDNLKYAMSNLEFDKETDIFGDAKKNLGIAKICTDLGRGVNCIFAVNELATKIMAVVSFQGLRISGTSYFEKMLEDPTYHAALLDFDRSILEPAINTGRVNGDIFRDLTEAFHRAGVSSSVSSRNTFSAAQQKALNVLGLIATGGANFFARFSLLGMPNEGENLLLSRLGVLLPYLDYMSPYLLYSIPNSIKSDCDTSKSYHFWLSTFLTRELLNKGYSRYDAAAAVFTAHLGYRLNEDHDLVYMSGNDPGLDIFHIDLTNMIAGIAFAIGPDENFSFQEIYDITLPDTSRVTTSIKPGTIESYYALTKKLNSQSGWDWLNKFISQASPSK